MASVWEGDQMNRLASRLLAKWFPVWWAKQAIQAQKRYANSPMVHLRFRSGVQTVYSLDIALSTVISEGYIEEVRQCGHC